MTWRPGCASKLVVAFCGAVALVLACGGFERTSADQAAAVRDGGTVSGIVRLDGAAPAPAKLEISRDKEVCGAAPHFSEELVVGAGGAIKDAVVSIAKVEHGEPLKARNVKIDQRGCRYEPHVLAFPAGSTVEVLNPDGISHDLRTYSEVNPPLNLVQPKSVRSIKVTVEKPERIRVACYMHPWMHAWWFVARNPYYAVTGADGRFTISNLPAGIYEISVWQEKLGEQKQSVTVKPGATSPANFVFKPAPAPGRP